MSHNYKKKKTPEIVHQRDLKIVQKRYPGVFNLENPTPLRVGIHKGMRRNLGWSRNRVARFLDWYCNSEPYRFAVANQGSKRIGLNGAVVQDVLEAHVDHAINWLKQA